MKQKVDIEKEILINIMYNGDYLQKNIGHEVINLIKADNESSYIYVNPYGTMAQKHNAKKPNETKIDTILLARRCEYKDTLEILAKAYDLEQCFPDAIENAHKIYADNNPNYYIGLLKKSYKKGMAKKTAEKLIKKIPTELSNENKNIIKQRIEYQCKPNDYQEEIKISDNILEQLKIHLQKNRENAKGLDIHKAQLKYIHDEGISYGNKCLDNIFKKNERNEYSIYTTFKAGKVVRVSEPLYILTNSDLKGGNFINLNENAKENEKIKFAKQSLKMYFNKNTAIINENNYEENENIQKNSEAFNKLKDIIENDDYWNYSPQSNQDDSKKIDKIENLIMDKQGSTDKKRNFVDIINKNYDELMYSNLFRYMFSNIEMFCAFINNVLLIKEKDENILEEKLFIEYCPELENGFEIIREKEKNIDLCIKIGQHLFVIENKIKSGLNGIKKDNKGNIIETQLIKYAKYANEKYGDKIRHYFLFSPSYNLFSEEELSIKLNNEIIRYLPITYRDILNFFSTKEIIKNYRDNNYIYIDECINAIERHSWDVDNIQERQMFERFADRIRELTPDKQQGVK